METTRPNAADREYADLPLLEELIQELQEYLGWHREALLERIPQGGFLLAEEWVRHNPRTPEEVTQFYQEAQNYLFDLAAWHQLPDRRQQTLNAMRLCQQGKLRKILDFGCGIGQDGMLFAQAGFEVTLADLPGRTFDFARWRAERSGLDIKSVSAEALKECYDAILCFDVLEHVWEPRNVLRDLHGHLSDTGFLLVSVAFQTSEHHPMHLRRNQRYQGLRFFNLMGEVGFCLEPSPYPTPLLFRKVNR